MSREEATKAFDIIARHPGESPLTLVSEDSALNEKIASVEDSSDLHAQLKQLLGPKCIYYNRQEIVPAEREMEQVS
jgi:DNA polymerase-3 subunit alpha